MILMSEVPLYDNSGGSMVVGEDGCAPRWDPTVGLCLGS